MLATDTNNMLNVPDIPQVLSQWISEPNVIGTLEHTLGSVIKYLLAEDFSSNSIYSLVNEEIDLGASTVFDNIQPILHKEDSILINEPLALNPNYEQVVDVLITFVGKGDSILQNNAELELIDED